MTAIYEKALVTDCILATEINVGFKIAKMTHITTDTRKILNDTDVVSFLKMLCIPSLPLLIDFPLQYSVRHYVRMKY